VILKAAATREVSLIEFLSFLEMRYKRNKPMTFDELWRLDFDRKRVGVDSDNKAKALGLIAVLGENPNELLLTAEDCLFLLEVGIRP
jgi:hypothetical protein